jgi:uncharacterized membrane protein SpoIIM required for sporulation
MHRISRQLLRKNCLLSLAVYLGSWMIGIALALKFIPQQMIAHIDIHPTQQDAWLYISHNLELELLFLAGALTLGVAPVLLLVWNGCLDGILATAVARHYGLQVVLVGLLPHGIPEALAWILLGTCSLLLSRYLRTLFFPGKKTPAVMESEPIAHDASLTGWRAIWHRLPWQLTNVYSCFIIGSALLIILAGILEATVSPWLMHTLG